MLRLQERIWMLDLRLSPDFRSVVHNMSDTSRALLRLKGPDLLQ